MTGTQYTNIWTIADGTEDAAKLRYAMGRATRKRHCSRRTTGAWTVLCLVTVFGFSQSYSSTDKFSSATSKVEPTGSQFLNSSIPSKLKKKLDFWNAEVNANSFIFNLLNVGMQFLLKNF